MRRLVSFCVAMVILTATAQGQEMGARASVDSTNYLVGDWITLHVLLNHPAGVVPRPLVGDTLAEFAVIRKDPAERVTDTRSTVNLVVAKYDSGMGVIPPVPFVMRQGRDSAIVSTSPVVVYVHTVAVDTSKEIRDIKGPLSIPMTLAELLTYIGIGALIVGAGVAWYLYSLNKKQETKKPAPAYVPPARPAHVIALEQLGLLKEKKLWQQGLIKQYYSEITDIIRGYLETRFRMRALEQTTDEILASISIYNLPHDVVEELEQMLRLADLVKFAKLEPGLDEHDRAMTVAHDIVHKTKPSPGAPPRITTPEPQTTAANVGS